jgi:23S rRNA pseudouridine2605 synthase
MQQRLQKILSACGVASRRAAEELIAKGFVTVNGVQAELGMKADPQVDQICVRGTPIKIPAHYVYIALNKPKGYVTTLHDERGRKSVDELVADLGIRVYPVGRLDMDSEGLLLLTNDGNFANAVAHPASGKEKIYHVTVRGNVDAALAHLGEPFELDGYITRPARVTLLKRTPDGAVLSVAIGEGRNRQVRRMCAHHGLSVQRLVRVQIGPIKLGRLQTGTWRHLTDHELASIRQE